MAHIEIENGILAFDRFGDRIQIRVPDGGRVEICTGDGHADVEIRERTGAVQRRFRVSHGEG